MVDQLHELIPQEVLQIFGPPALLSTEDPKLYHQMLNLAASELRPSDLIGWLLVKNLIDQLIEIARYRRLIAAYIPAAHKRSIQGEIAAIQDRRTKEDTATLRLILAAPKLRRKYINQNRKAAAEASAKIAVLQATCPTEADFASILPEWIREHERLSHLLRAAENRFSATRTEIDQHYRGLGKVLRENLDRTIEAEVKPQREPKRRELVRRTGHKAERDESEVSFFDLETEEEGSEAQEGLR